MEITEKNLRDLLPEIESAISSATFLTFDTEFTGLAVQNAEAFGVYDSADEAYNKLKLTSGFGIVQFGLCTFHENEDNPNTFRFRAFNFYIRPNAKEFLCQTESIVFLAKCGLDFNKVFLDGIVSMSPAEKEKELEYIKNKIKELEAPPSADDVPKTAFHIENIPEKDKCLVENAKVKLEEFLLDESKDQMTMEKCNSFQRLLIYQVVEKHFIDKVFLLTSKDGKRNRELIAYKGGEKERKAAEIKQLKEQEENVNSKSGFLAVLTAIKNAKKPVVGHYIILDIFHTIHQFFDVIPSDMKAFKDIVRENFPRFIDTKMMSTKKPLSDKIENSMLEVLARNLQKDPFKLKDAESIDETCKYSVNAEKLHEAAYDAYITGLCFIAMAQHLDKSSKSFEEILNSDALEPFTNKILFAPAADDGYFNIMGEEVPPSTEHVFHVAVPTTWKTSDVVQLFSAYGSVRIIWLGDEECYVALDKKTEASKVKSLIKKQSNGANSYKIQTMATYKANKMCGGRRRRPSDYNNENRAKKSKSTSGTEETNDTPMDTTESNSDVFEENAMWE